MSQAGTVMQSVSGHADQPSLHIGEGDVGLSTSLTLVLLGDVKVEHDDFYVKFRKTSSVQQKSTYSCRKVLQICLDFRQDVKK